MSEPRISFEPFADPAIKEFIVNGVDFHSIAATGHAAWYPVQLFLRGERDEVLGGLLGQIWGSWLQIRYLWVAEPARGAGNATRLMRAAEDYAIERGCVGANLGTYSFQALGFYQKLGYRVYGTLEDCPPGHATHHLSKALK